jgi:outer membrane autotransporter protein
MRAFVVAAAALVGAIHPTAVAWAAKPDFQSYFFDVCSGSGNPTGALGARCADTPGGLGDLSGDSEDSLYPTQFVGTNESAIVRARALERMLESRMEAIRDETADPDRRPRASEGALNSERARLSLLVNGRWSGFDRDETSNERGIEGDLWSAQIGGDYRIARGIVLGGLFTYDRLDSEFDSDAPGVNFSPFSREGIVDANWYSLAVYASFQSGDAGLYGDLSAGAGFASYEIERSVVFQESTRTVAQTGVRTNARPDAYDLQASGTLGYDFALGAATFGPYGRIVYVGTDLESFTERSASGLEMRVDGQSRDSFVTVVGARLNYAFSLPLGVVIPQLRAEWEHEFAREAQVAHTRFVLDTSSSDFRVRGESPDRDYANLGASLIWVLPGGWLPFVDYQVLAGYEDLDRHSVTVGLRKEF